MTRHGNKSIARTSRVSPQRQTTTQHEGPGFISNVMIGFAVGTGQAIAHNLFRKDVVVHHNSDNKQSIPPISKEYEQCMKDNNNNKELCKQFLT